MIKTKLNYVEKHTKKQLVYLRQREKELEKMNKILNEKLTKNKEMVK